MNARSCRSLLLICLGIAMYGCAGSGPAAKPSATPAQGRGAIGGTTTLGAGTAATGVLDESYLYDQHQRAVKPAAAGRTAPNPPWTASP